MNPKEKDELREIKKALIEQRLYNPHDVFHHVPDFYKSNDSRYVCEIHCIKWNTKSTKISIYLARFDEKKGRWVFAKKSGVKRTPHGEKMR